MALMRLLFNLKKNKGFNLIELMVVMGIMALILVFAGLSFYPRYRSGLLLEQAAQDVSSEIKLVQSRALAVQEIQVGALKFTPKAAVIKLETGANPEIYYLNPSSNVNNPCNGPGAGLILEKTLTLGEKANVSKISRYPSSQINEPVYLIYAPPVSRFYIVRSNSLPSFINSMNKSCKPNLANISDDIIITFSSDNRDIFLRVDNQTGSVTVTN